MYTYHTLIFVSSSLTGILVFHFENIQFVCRGDNWKHVAWVEGDPSREMKLWWPASRAAEAGKTGKDLEMSVSSSHGLGLEMREKPEYKIAARF